MEISRIALTTGSQSISELYERISGAQAAFKKVSLAEDMNQLRARLEPYRASISHLNEIGRFASSVYTDFSANALYNSKSFHIDGIRQSLLPAIEAAKKFQEQYSGIVNLVQGVPDFSDQIRQFSVDKALEASIVNSLGIFESVQKSFASTSLRDFDGALFRQARFQNLTESFGTLAQTHKALWEETSLSSTPSLEYFSTVVSRTPVELYQAATLLKSIGEIPMNHHSRQAEQMLDDESDKVEDKLAALDPRLVTAYRGAKSALESHNPDRARHFAVSIRELLTHVFQKLSPDHSFHDWNKDPSLVHAGKPTRRGRLLYICRSVNHGSFSEFMNADLKAALQFLSLFQEGTHSLDSEFTEIQLHAMMRRTEGLISFLLDIALIDDI